MMQVCFLLPEGILKPSSLFSAIEIFEKANEYCISKRHKSYYDIKMAGVKVSQNILNCVFDLGTVSINEFSKPDLIIIPGLGDKNNFSIAKNKTLLEWLIKQYNNGAELASLCTGSFLLAATGLLKNKECSTHWKAEESFIKMYPDVKLRIDKVITDNKGIYTAGGANSCLNLILYLVEKYNGRDTALYCAKILGIDIDRNTQSQFILFEGQKNHDDEEIKKVQHFIEKNIDEKITVEFLSSKFLISKRSLVRRFKKATNNPPIEYIQRIKIEAAKRNLEKNRKTINEIMYSVGYNDTKAFRNIFKKITGLSPLEYRNKYNKDFLN